MFFICALRLNVVLLALFLCLTMSFGFLAGAYWNLSGGHMSLALKLQTVSLPYFHESPFFIPKEPISRNSEDIALILSTTGRRRTNLRT